MIVTTGESNTILSPGVGVSECHWLDRISTGELYGLMVGGDCREKEDVILHAIASVPGCVVCAKKIAKAMGVAEERPTKSEITYYGIDARKKLGARLSEAEEA